MRNWRSWIKRLSPLFSIAGFIASVIKVFELLSRHKNVIVATLEFDPIIISAFFQWLAIVFLLLTLCAFWTVIRKVIKTPNECRFRKLHTRIIAARDLLPDHRWRTRPEYFEIYAKNVAPVLDEVNGIRADLKKLDIHVRGHAATWRDSFDQVANYSRVSDLKEARKNFLD